MTLNDIIIDIANAPILDINEELEKFNKNSKVSCRPQKQEYNWIYDANGSPIEEVSDE